MKAYTSLEQSRKLTEILPIESADMGYAGEKEDSICCGFGDVEQELYTDYGDGHPCWSLAALLALLPKEINVLGTIYSINIHTKNEEWFIDYKCNNEEFVGVYSNILVDACFEMIVKLHEQNIL